MTTDQGMTIAASATAAAPTPPVKRDAFGCNASHLEKDLQLVGEDISFYRKWSSKGDFGRVATPAADRGFVIGVSMSADHHRRIYRGPHASDYAFDQGSIYIRDFQDDYQAELTGSFDFVLIELSRDFTEQTCHPSRRLNNIACATGQVDRTLFHLMQALEPALENPLGNRLFIDQLGVAIGTHLSQRYAGQTVSAQAKKRLLSRMQEVRAKEMLLLASDDYRSIAEIARECHLSPSYFIYAFRETTGQTPYQWLLAQRIKLACALLKDPNITLADVAMRCGFSDQSHFTRVFARALRATPGAWRRAERGA